LQETKDCELRTYMTDMIVLKKYANRRLYDTNRSAYVTLSEVAEDIRQGKTVKAFDAKTSEDVTAFVLTQIVLEEAKKNNVLLPVPLLHMIIRYGENVLHEFFENYLEQTINSYVAYKRQADEQFRNWLEVGMDLSGMAQQSLARLNPFQAFFDQSRTSKPPKKKNEE
jgi:polyhydroxyalkanoate synthesis repressor PhaR